MIITNLFSMFDPSLSVISTSWLVVPLTLLIIPSIFINEGVAKSCYSALTSTVNNEVSYTINTPPNGVYFTITTVVVILASLNLIALFPHLFSATSHLIITLPLAFTIWLSIILFSWVSSLNIFLAHLVPIGTPTPLVSFIVVVEVLSNLIRPVALTFRITANIIAGHLILSLLSGALINISIAWTITGIPILTILTSIEIGVSLIQAYVFSSLVLLYISESNSN